MFDQTWTLPLIAENAVFLLFTSWPPTHSSAPNAAITRKTTLRSRSAARPRGMARWQSKIARCCSRQAGRSMLPVSEFGGRPIPLIHCRVTYSHHGSRCFGGYRASRITRCHIITYSYGSLERMRRSYDISGDDQIAFRMGNREVQRRLVSDELPVTVLLPTESYAS
jgi:hypothetical protein